MMVLVVMSAGLKLSETILYDTGANVVIGRWDNMHFDNTATTRLIMVGTLDT